jgi:hypothetical protein
MKLTSFASIVLIGPSLSARTTTYRESNLGDEPLEEPTDKVPNCSFLTGEPRCKVERPFDPRDEEL